MTNRAAPRAVNKPVLRVLLLGVLIFGFAQACFANTLTCVGTDSVDATFVVTAALTDAGQFDPSSGIFIRKIDTAGFQYDWSMLPKYSTIVVDQSISSQGPFNGGQLTINATFQKTTGNYTGTMLSWGNAGGIVDIAISCTFKP